MRGEWSRLGHRGLPFPFLLAFRYLKSTRKDAFVSFLSAVAAGGISLGVGALVLALAALSGLQSALRDEVLARTPHLEVELPPGADVEAVGEMVAALEGVTRVQEVVKGRGWVRWGRFVRPIELLGFSGRVPSIFPGAAGMPPGLYVSDGLASRWGLQPGQVVEVISPRITLSPLGPQPRARSLAISGTFETGLTEEDDRIALPIEVARPLAGGAGSFLELGAVGLDEAVALVPVVAAVVPSGATVRTWKDLNRPLFFALRLEKTMMFVAVSLVVVVAALALVADLALVISSKRAELGILSAMGATPGSLRSAFLVLGGLLAGLGMSVGALLGTGLALFLDRYRLVRLPSEVYFLDYLPFRVEIVDLAAVLLVTMVLALGSASWVAQRVGRLRAIEAIRR